MSIRTEIKRKLGISPRFKPQYVADGFGVSGKNLGFLEDPKLAHGWSKALEGNRNAWGGQPPDIRWRAHIALWAAQHGMKLEGDFVECGVFLGLLSLSICHALEFEKSDKRLFLFDTYAGIPDDGTTGTFSRNSMYFDCFEQAKANFSPFPNAILVQGVLPNSLGQVNIEKIAYLSMDLNVAPAEIAVITELWSKLVSSALVILDDYAFVGHEPQYAAWNAFAASKSIPIATLPTGQGLLIKPPAA